MQGKQLQFYPGNPGNDTQQNSIAGGIPLQQPEEKRKMKMKKLTIIRKQKFRDGSVKRAKQQIYGLTLTQAVESVKNETNKTFDFGK